MGPVRISGRQFFYIIMSVALGLQLVAVPPIAVREAGQGVWLSMALAVAADIAIALVLYLLGRRYPGRTLFQYSQEILGPVPGRLAACAMALFFLHTAALTIRNYSDMFLLSLPETPLVVLVAVFCVVAAYGSSRGFEVVGRVAEVQGPLGVLSVVAVLLLFTTRADAGHLLPLLPRPADAVYASLLPAAVVGNCAIMGVLMAYHEAPERVLAQKAAAVLAGISLFTAMLLGAIAVLRPALAAQQLIPIITAVRIIEVGQFLERLEVLFMVTVVALGSVSIKALLGSAALGVAQVAGVRDFRSLVWPLALWLCFIALALPSRAAVARFLAEGYPLYALSHVVGVPVLLLAVSLLRPR